MREDFRTTLNPQSKIDLKVLAAKEKKSMCELLEELIEERRIVSPVSRKPPRRRPKVITEENLTKAVAGYNIPRLGFLNENLRAVFLLPILRRKNE